MQVWRIFLSAPPSFPDTLAAEELSHAVRFHFERHRMHYVIARGALRMLAARYLGCEPGELRFDVNPHGKPFLPAARLQFNLAHSHELALVAFTLDAEIGIDLEWRASRIRLDEMASAILSPNELEVWKELSENDRHRSFFWHWTAKEAYLKALGVGLSKNPKTIETVSLPIRELIVETEYVAALATLGDGVPEVQQFTFCP